MKNENLKKRSDALYAWYKKHEVAVDVGVFSLCVVSAGISLFYLTKALKVLRDPNLVHGPCVEVSDEGAEALLKGAFMILKVAGGDVFYKIVDHEPS